MLTANRELLAIPGGGAAAAGGKGTGTLGEEEEGGFVAHVSEFVARDRESGVERRCANVTIARVAVEEGSRVLVELDEIIVI